MQQKHKKIRTALNFQITPLAFQFFREENIVPHWLKKTCLM